MSDEMKKLFEEALKMLLNAVKEGSAFAREQMPIVVQEKLTYDLISTYIVCVFCVLLLFAGLAWAYYWLNRATSIEKIQLQKPKYLGVCNEEWNIWWRNKNRIENYTVAGIIPSVLVILISIVVLIRSGMIILRITYAPHLYILEWLKGML